jgi:hypothetical protein
MSVPDTNSTASLANWSATTESEQLWNIWNATNAGGGGGGDTDVAVAPDGVTRVPLNVNSDGELKVNVDATVDADLTSIENKLDTLIGIATPQAADIASINTETLSIDNKLPALSGGLVPVQANNAASQVYNYTSTGAISSGTVLIGPVDCSQFREVSVQVLAVGTGGTAPVLQISNDGTNWLNISVVNTNGAIASTMGSGAISVASLFNAKQFRVLSQGNQTSGTTTLVAYASQQATPKLYQSVVVTGSPTVVTNSAASPSYGFGLYHTLVSAASTNATSVKGSAGTIGTLSLTNASMAWAFFKLVNKASAPTPGTDTAVINIGVAPNTTLDCSTAFAGLRMTTGIAYYVSAGTSLTDNTALPVAGTFLVNMTYV